MLDWQYIHNQNKKYLYEGVASPLHSIWKYLHKHTHKYTHVVKNQNHKTYIGWACLNFFFFSWFYYKRNKYHCFSLNIKKLLKFIRNVQLQLISFQKFQRINFLNSPNISVNTILIIYTAAEYVLRTKTLTHI